MEQNPLNSPWRDEPPAAAESSKLREWTVKARMISRDNTKSRRFSSSYITSALREDLIRSSFTSNITISTSTVSSPGYNFKEEIDPSTYSFTTALKELQARSVNTWEFLSPEGNCINIALNSKWSEAEKYICNPVSGEVPMECLSSKTLLGTTTSFRNNRITMSAPLIYPNSHSRFAQTKPCFPTYIDPHINVDEHYQIHNVPPIKEKRTGNNMTRDVGVQSTPPDLSSSSTTSASSPQAQDKLEMTHKFNSTLGPNSTDFIPKSIFKNEETVDKRHARSMKKMLKGEMKARSHEKEAAKGEEMSKKAAGEQLQGNMWKCKWQVGCLWMSSRVKHKPKKHKNKNKNIFPLAC